MDHRLNFVQNKLETMADEPRLAINDAILMRNMEGFVPNSGGVMSRQVFYDPNMGWYAHHPMPVSSGGGIVLENPNFVYQAGGGGVIGESPTSFGYRGIGGGSPMFDSRSNVGDQASDDGLDDRSSGNKVKFLCSFGGQILRRPSDGVLRYVGGETRIISLKRDVSFQELVHKMIDVYGKPVIIKYQLPDGDLDALVSVSCPEDLENMMDEYGKLVESSLNGSAKLRVFLFSGSQLDPPGLVQFSGLLDSGQRYVDAVNGILDGVGGGISSQVSIESAASTQNSDGPIGGSESVDGSSHGQGDGGGLSSPCMSSPRIGAVASHDTPTSMVYVPPNNPVMYAPSMPAGSPTVLTGFPQNLSSLQPEHEFRRPVPAMVQSQAPFGYDSQNPSGMEYRPAAAYMQAYVDPHQQLSSQIGYQNPHGFGIAGSIYRYAEPPPQFRDNVAGIAHQQFMHAVPMSVASLDPRVGMNTNVSQQVMQPPQTQVDPYLGENTLKGRVVKFPVEQNCPVYQPESPPHPPTIPLQAGGGCGLMPISQHFVFSDGRVTHQPGYLPEKILNLEDCFMCQKALPHAHSDTVVQEHPRVISQIYHTASDNLRPIDGRLEGSHVSPPEVLRSNEQCSSPVYELRKEDLPVMPIGTLPSSSSEVVHFDSSHPVESNQITKPVRLGISEPYPHLNMPTQCMPSEELLHGKPALSGVDSDSATYATLLVGEKKDEAPGFQSRTVSNDDMVCPSGPSSGSNLSSYGGMFGDNQEHSPSKSLFSNQDPWILRHDPHFLPPKTNKETTNEEAFITREEEFLRKPSGHLNKDANSQHLLSNKDVAEKYINQELRAVTEEVPHKPSKHVMNDSPSEHNPCSKDEYVGQELKAVAEGVAAMVLEPSVPDDSFVHGMDESSLEISHGGVLDIGVEATAKVEDVKTKLQDKEKSGPLSEGIGRLQIIKNSDLEELRELGSGTFGTVYHGKWRGSDVAIKRFNDRCFSGKPSEKSRMIDDFWNEAINLADLHHPNVVAFYGVVLDGPGDSVATVTEFMVNGSLRHALQRTLDKRKRLLIAMDVAFGMEYLHGKNIVHFDLKSDNLLVNLRDPHRPICKVGDLGLSKMKCHTLISGGVRGTLPWMAPELLNGSSSRVSEKVDVFSFGIVMWELLTGEEPYADLHYGVIIGGIVSNTLRPPVPESCDPKWRYLMETCWSSEPSQRPSFTEIVDQLRSIAASLPPKGQPQQ